MTAMSVVPPANVHHMLPCGFVDRQSAHRFAAAIASSTRYTSEASPDEAEYFTARRSTWVISDGITNDYARVDPRLAVVRLTR